MDGIFFLYRGVEKCIRNAIRRTKQKVMLKRYRCVRVDDIKMNLKERTFNILISSHYIEPRVQWVCFRHVNEISVFP